MAVGRDEREGVSSRDLLLEGRVRRGIQVTLILAPEVGLVAWVHYAPALGDAFRKTYRQLLKWNDELPFVKFGLSAEDDIVLSSESPPAGLDGDGLGRTVARLVAVCDLLHEASAGFLGQGAAASPGPAEPPRPSPLLERFAADLVELAASPA